MKYQCGVLFYIEERRYIERKGTLGEVGKGRVNKDEKRLY
jgi:hypothetical protein